MNHPSLENFKALRQKIGTIKASNYDITSICNLKCEGCLYFEGADYLNHIENKNLSDWDAFFESEALRGINFAYIAGAEPSFFIDRIQAAQKHIQNGVVFTNGTKRIPDTIQYRIHISIWGIENELKLRGKSVLKEALRNYTSDPRVVFTFTINKSNLHQIIPAIQLCYEHHVQITFSFFSATKSYLSKLNATEKHSNGKYFRISSQSDNLILTLADFELAKQRIEDGSLTYKNTVLHSNIFHDYVSSHNYELDANGIAKNCGNLLSKDFRHYGVDMKRSKGACCSPNIDCTQCKAYTNMYATYLKHPPSARSPEFNDWLKVWALWGEIFLNRHSQ